MKICSECSVKYPDAVEFCPRDGRRLPPPVGGAKVSDPLLGTTIDGRYIVEALLGEGGMGFVYAARHAIIDKRVAIKVLRKEAAQDESATQRFLDEARACSKIGHQNIVDITDFGVLPERHAYFVMEFLDGPTLGKLMRGEKQLAAARAIPIATQIARGLHAAHQASIIHRDLKPENVFVLERDGDHDLVKIVDFGIAKDVKAGKRLTAAGVVLGTPEYMSPEQASGQNTDHRVDMYALGCILYEMLVGDVPFRGENAPKTLTMQVFDPVTPPSARRRDLVIPAALEAVVLRLLEKKPALRYPDMMAVIAALDDAERKLTRPARTPPSVPMLAVTAVNAVIPRHRTRRWVAVGGGVTLGLLVLALVLNRQGRPAGAALVHDPKAAPTVAAEARPSVDPGAVEVTRPKGGADAPAPDVAVHSPVAPAATAEGAAAGGVVHLRLTSTPPGAQVLLDDQPIGRAPLDLRRPPSATPVTLTLRHHGYQDSTRRLLLDRDQRLAVQLTPRARVAARPGPEDTPTPALPTRKSPRATTSHSSDLRNPFN